ncbi:MAG TPA: ATP-binding protein [Steroidobacteraceae bacterium]|nr:ATP-binding protein [Steroidobacteraceae bacterium]
MAVVTRRLAAPRDRFAAAASRLAAGLRGLAGRVRFDSSKISLSWWLAVSQVVIVLAVAGGLSAYAIGRLHDLADEHGKSRVQLAGAMAREDLRRMSEDALTQVRVLADRPTLERLLAEGHSEQIALFLRRFCDANTIDGCAVFDSGNLIAQAGTPLPWSEVADASMEQGPSFLAAPPGAPAPMLGASAPLTGRPTARVFVARLLGDRLAKTLTQQVGLPIRLVDYRAFAKAPVDPLTALHTAGLADGNSAVQRIKTLDLYAASFPLFASTGEAIALIEVRLPAATIDSSASRLIRHLLITALVLVVLAVLAGILLGQYVTGPVQALTDAAVRLGRGDFSTSIPSGGAAEVGALARTMEDMRRNLIDLTGTLRRREAEAQAVLGGIVEGVYAVDRDRMIRYLNPQAARLLGIDAAQAVGRFCGDVLLPCALDASGTRPCEVSCPIVQARSEGTARAVEHLQTARRGMRTTLITSSGLVEGLQVQVIRDETELEAVRRARDSVLANISHEFRTPLAAQLASIELLRERLAGSGAEHEPLVRSLERGTLRLTRLIDNLLESVRIESGQLGIRRQSVELAEVIEEAQSLVGSLLSLRQQTLEVNLPEGLGHISGDQSRLTQVFVNLLANANKFAPEGSVLRIGAVQHAETIDAWVEDEGPGVLPSEGRVIFEPFRRGAGEEPEPGGLGLGLWIVKSIVDRHGGSIAVTRTAEARTRFTVTLPLERAG